MTLPPTGQPTNQQTIGLFLDDRKVPVRYVSLRVTVLHSKWEESVLPLIQDADWYISYPHSGKNGNNEHFHILLSGSTAADRERYRKRFKVAGYTGNQHLSIKLCENCVTSAITYCRRELTEPYIKGCDVSDWIKLAPDWVEQRTKKRKAGDDFVQLTCVNLLKVCFEFHRQEKLKTTDLAMTMEIMLNRGTYVMSPTLMRQGAPSWMESCFKESVEVGELRWSCKFWRAGVFRDFSSRF